MGFEIVDLGIAASVFLGLYLCFFGLAVYAITQKGFKSVYSWFFFYGIVRTGGQVSGVGFAIAGETHYQWLIAYMVMSVEGYFALVMASLYILCIEQKRVWGVSPLETPFITIRGAKRSYKSLFHLILVPGNALLIAGGCMLTGLTVQQLANNHSKIVTSRALRTTGQAIFLVQSLSVSALSIHSYFFKNLRSVSMKMLLVIIPFITMRGVYGLVSIYIDKMDYFLISNYISIANHKDMTIYEYTLGTSMEFISAFVMVNTVWFSKGPINEDTGGLSDGDSKV
ncbi:hypothetical protein PSN45_001911 [Yamadazyma tenuis]|uniref:Uncharacterized protein n=1 Tax=Candida tenuis (strain ATCC 10573 / BCRC 21748 / CBS 615 / JCM 9827 / NBRC 10315 / NRRL Y-1498 / VKM Y-70) TaxID=590646 RepID=G3BDM1_CANTC|nr:uncharacterized protein CANTEDRAFT_116386 [Yamadazyma tenuis ATCC 10573]EGV60336.1 hypothetical protein CANTEDRAFT_116386 [Yamadazyma tenuis ATCC 10573]WEJ94427.1 hypothetical protein PSN45_001911 [Yamadazyma tenuis]